MAPLQADGPELYPGERALAEAAAREGLIVATNTALGWANWGAVAKAFGERYPGLTLVHNDIGSTGAVTLLDRQRERPIADTVYYFTLVALDAASRGVLAPHRPLNIDRIASTLHDGDGLWSAVHHLPVAFIVNRKLVKSLPRSWAELRKPDYKGQIVYFDPVGTSVGMITVLAANHAAGGSLSSVRPGIDYFAQLHRAGNVKSVESVSPYARFLKGEIPIWISFEMDGLRARTVDGFEDVEVILPSDGTATAAYAMSLVKGARNEAGGKLWYNFVLSEPAQRLFAEGHVRPALTGLSLPQDLAGRLPPLPRLDIPDPLRATLRKTDIDRAWPTILAGGTP